MRGSYLKPMAVALGVLFVAACGDEPADRPVDRTADAPAAAPTAEVRVPEGATSEQVEQGRQLFTGQGACHACHGPQARGTQLAPDLTDSEWLNASEPTMAEVSRVIREGVAQPVRYPAPMPPMGGARLNQEQIDALSAYILSLN